MCYTCQESYDYAKRYTTSETDTRRMGRTWLKWLQLSNAVAAKIRIFLVPVRISEHTY